ncbi:hypothetical protein [Deinococcus cellulosilyticus]|nr:hypothetical protein [Deinococcus cellulosilyticus]
MHPDAIVRLIEKRHHLLPLSEHGLIRGRILCVGEETDTAMGEGVPASDGLIDNNYLPPWDSWFAYLAGNEPSSGILLAWIPEPLEHKVQAALEVAATQPLIWLDQINQPHQWGGNPMQERLAREAYVVLIERHQE